MEWTGLLLLVCLIAGGAVAVAPVVDGRSFGGFLAHRFVCSVRGHCRDGQVALARAYGAADAALVREHAPGLVYEPGERQLPVDYARCRSRACADAPDDRDLDAHRTGPGRARDRVHAPAAPWRQHLHPVLALLPRLELHLGGLGRDLGAQPSAAADRQGAARHRRVPGLPRGRLGGLPGPDRPGRARLGARQLARPLPGLQAGDLPQPLDASGRLDARVAREPCRPHPRSAVGAGPSAPALQAGAARRGSARAHLHRRRACG